MIKLSLLNRRDFMTKTALASGTLLVPLNLTSSNLFSPKEISNNNLELHVFSKCLQFLDYKDLCKAVKEIGFDGIDLTVRPNGHVLPENVLEDLPKATEQMKLYGLIPKMITTKVISPKDATQILVLETAKEQGYQFYRSDWLRYDRNFPVTENLDKAKTKLNNLAELNHKTGISGAYQNHSGHFIGSSIWGLQQVLAGILPTNLGVQYDIAHASIEGGKNWEIGFDLIKPHINTLAIKDYKWKNINGKWRPAFCPLGEGMIDFHYYFSLLKKHQINVPISLHAEYDLGGAEKGKVPTINKLEVLKRLKKDVTFIRKIWNEVNTQ
ncbi:sugar phosphate isomerase/epimerase [Lutibacter sp. A64]|uniref:sugar phosphate isomerase/epimerase family protein n=1 Tax=Lutibacter sp. A64 TaxID=2918526 RepID=UPI001F070400|nr:sugar phosphate isomerase/epimerase family protein [Lutibacter sp. A64]UMB55111.1 sugar phosphate isomerase/epimerase [Lutibacter sp. A64]